MTIMEDNLAKRICSTPEGLRTFWREGLYFAFTEAICEVMQNKGVSQKQLAELAGKTQMWLDRRLCDGDKLSLRDAADIFTALGVEVVITTQPFSVEAKP